MITQIEAMKLALKTLEQWDDPFYKRGRAIAVLQEALAEQPAQQEPDYWLGYGLQAYTEKPFDGATPVWASPQPPAQPLTDEQIAKCYERTGHYQALRPQDRFAVFALARAIEAAHGITKGNT